MNLFIKKTIDLSISPFRKETDYDVSSIIHQLFVKKFLFWACLFLTIDVVCLCHFNHTILILIPHTPFRKISHTSSNFDIEFLGDMKFQKLSASLEKNLNFGEKKYQFLKKYHSNNSNNQTKVPALFKHGTCMSANQSIPIGLQGLQNLAL